MTEEEIDESLYELVKMMPLLQRAKAKCDGLNQGLVDIRGQGQYEATNIDTLARISRQKDLIRSSEAEYRSALRSFNAIAQPISILIEESGAKYLIFDHHSSATGRFKATINNNEDSPLLEIEVAPR